MPFSKNLSGTCEPDNTGRYETKEDCENAGANNDLVFDQDFQRYLVREVASYDPDWIMRLAPSDRSRVFRDLYNVSLPVDDTQNFFTSMAILTKDFFHLYYRNKEETRNFWERELDDYDIVILDVLYPHRRFFLNRLDPVSLL